MIATIQGKTVELVQGDITQQQVDAIVNAANSRLMGGGGVDGAIHRRGGPSIMDETERRYPKGCPTGSAVISGAGQLPARYVIHAVGPIWHGGNSGEELLLAGAISRALELAAEHDCDSIAIPAISTGAYGFPLTSRPSSPWPPFRVSSRTTRNRGWCGLCSSIRSPSPRTRRPSKSCWGRPDVPREPHRRGVNPCRKPLPVRQYLGYPVVVAGPAERRAARRKVPVGRICNPAWTV